MQMHQISSNLSVIIFTCHNVNCAHWGWIAKKKHVLETHDSDIVWTETFTNNNFPSTFHSERCAIFVMLCRLDEKIPFLRSETYGWLWCSPPLVLSLLPLLALPSEDMSHADTFLWPGCFALPPNVSAALPPGKRLTSSTWKLHL